MLRLLGLEAPRELYGIPEDLRSLAGELRRRVETLEAADAQTQSAAASVAAAFGGLFTRKAVMAAVAPNAAGAKSPQGPPASRAAEDARRLMKELKPKGLFDLADFDRGRELISEAERSSEKNPRYAAAFLHALGPENLRWLIEKGQLDPCKLGAVAARASQNGVGVSVLKKTIGTDRFDAPRRAALLSAGQCPEAQFDPAWVDAMATALLTGRDPPGQGDPRRWYREAAATLLRTHPAGAIRFINKHEKLFCGSLLAHHDQGGRAAQGALDDMLGHPPPGMEKQAEDALERATLCARRHPFDPPGKQALARLLARPETMRDVAERLAVQSEGRPPGAEGFRLDRDDLRPVLAALAADPKASKILLDAATGFTSEQLAAATPHLLNNRSDWEANRALAEIGALFGALASRSYEPHVALNMAEVGTDAVKGILESLAGASLEAAKLNPVVSLAVEGGKTILFAIGSGEAARSQAEAEMRKAADDQERREKLISRLDGDLHHLAYVSLLADPSARARLALKLDPNDIPPELPRDITGEVEGLLENAGIDDVREWKNLVFDEDGRINVPDPHDDPRRWDAFVAWAGHVNPDLAAAADQMAAKMHAPFMDQVGRSQ